MGTGRVPRNVLITDARISAISAGDIPASADTTVIDGAGHTLMPGLTDAHWHMMAVRGVSFDGADDGLPSALMLRDAQAKLVQGFTTVRDAMGPVFGVSDAIDQGIMPGPRCYPSGAAISQTSGHGDHGPLHPLPHTIGGPIPSLQAAGVSVIANGVPEVLATVRAQLKKGASQTKIMGGGGVTSDYDPIDTLQFTTDEIRAAVDAASDWGTYVMAHVYTPGGIRRCVEAGVKTIEHGHAIDDRTAALVAERGAWLSTQPFETGDNILTPQQKERADQSLGPNGWETSVRLAKKHGVKLAFGSDLFSRTAGSQTANAMLARLGRIYSNAEVLRIATSGNCEMFALSGARDPYGAARLGVIAEGAWADMLLVKGNPLDDLGLLADFERNLLLVIKHGTIHKNSIVNG